MEFADVESIAELLACALPKLGDFQLPQFVSQSLSRPDDLDFLAGCFFTVGPLSYPIHRSGQGPPSVFQRIRGHHLFASRPTLFACITAA